MLNIDGVFPYPLGTGKDNGDDQESHSLGLGMSHSWYGLLTISGLHSQTLSIPKAIGTLCYVSPGGQVFRDTVPIDPGDEAALNG